MRLLWPVMRMLTSRPSDAICELVGTRPYRFVEGRREETTFANTDTLDQLLLRRFGARWGGALPPNCHAVMTFQSSGILRCPVLTGN